MANISNAFGTIKFVCKDKHVLEILYNSIANMDGEYYTFIDNFDKEKVNVKEDTYTYADSFNACGRWTYLSNISYYSSWIEVTKEEENILKSNPWQIEYDFVDEECGCCVLYQANVIVKHDKDTEVKEAKITEEITDYDYTWVNLIKLGYHESIAECVENKYYMCMENEDYAQWFLDDFEENKKDIAKYLGCDVNDIEALLKKSGIYEIYEKTKKLANA